jgi:hypothetical protein
MVWALRHRCLSKQRTKRFKINGLGYYREAFSVDHPTCDSIPMQRGAGFFSVGALPYSVALVFKFVIFILMPHIGLSEGSARASEMW